MRKAHLTHEVAESKDYPGQWHVEAVDDDGSVFVAVFSGPQARERAAEYADWKNGVRHQAAVLQLVGRP
jgi:hypothetical protein